MLRVFFFVFGASPDGGDDEDCDDEDGVEDLGKDDEQFISLELASAHAQPRPKREN